MRKLLRTLLQPGFSIPFFVAFALVQGGFPWPVRFQGRRLGIVFTNVGGRRTFVWGVDRGLMLPAPIQHFIVHTWNAAYCKRKGHRWILSLEEQGLPLAELPCVDCATKPTPQQVEEIRQAREQAKAGGGAGGGPGDAEPWKARTGY